MQREYDGVGGVGFRITLAIVAAIWVWMFLPIMDQLQLLSAAPTFISVFLAFAVLEMLPFVSVRIVGVLVTALLYVWYYFKPGGVPLGKGLALVVSALWRDVTMLVTNHNLVDPLQTVLFIGALAAVYWLVVYAGSRKRLWLFYNGLAILILALVDGNTPVHPNQALVVNIILFVFILGFHQYHSLLRTQVSRKNLTVFRFFGPLSGVIILSLLVAVVLPKQQAVWANPFQKSGSAGVGEGGSSQLVIGYQSNNAHLGGSFSMNYTPVLAVITKYPTYLRGQSYSTYTGKGWIQLSPASSQLTASNHTFALQPTATFGNLPSQQVSQKITVLSNNLRVPVLFGAYSLDKLVGLNGAGADVQVHTATGDVSTLHNLTQNESYTVDSRELEDPSAVLSHQTAAASPYPPSIQNLYLELPSSLPHRVQTLTAKVVAGDKNEYDKVMSVLNYLQSNFTYATQGIPVPGPGQDYVAQFLFQTQRGYCNNFSSAMAVMLRTIGIPTRWVTGFTYGVQDYNYTGPGSKFIISDADAHSWVEVYFPNFGWVPFDPTPNFSMTFAPTPNGQNATPSTPSSTPATTPKKPPIKVPPIGQGGVGGPASPFGRVASILLWALGILLLGLIVAAVFMRRRLHAARLWSGMTSNALSRAMAHLLKLLAKFRGLPNSAPTLRELMPLARAYGVHEQDYRELVHTAEKAWYAGQPLTQEEMEHARRTWGGWIKRVYERRRFDRRWSLGIPRRGTSQQLSKMWLKPNTQMKEDTERIEKKKATGIDETTRDK